MKNPSNSGAILKIIIWVSIIIATISIYLLFSIEIPKKPMAGQGNMQDEEVQIGGDFELIDQDGTVFNSNALRGKLSLIYFGFTYCPDICPTSLQKITEVVNILDKYHIDITPVFITIDPTRDTPELLKQYLKHFHPRFVGLTGSEDQIKDVANKFKVYYARAGQDSNQVNYMLDHSSFAYLISCDGSYIKHFYFDSKSDEMIDFIRINK